MKNTRRNLYAQNVQLQAQLVACGPDMTLSRKQLRARLQSARSEVDNLTARASTLTAKTEAQEQEIKALKAKLAEVEKASKAKA